MQKRLWRLPDPQGGEITCHLESISAHRLLLTVTRRGEAIVTETFSDERDALARSVGIYKEMNPAGKRR